MDQCISDLIGDEQTGAVLCNSTEECWRFIRNNNTQGYKTTHEALCFIVGEVRGELDLERLSCFSSYYVCRIQITIRDSNCYSNR